MMYVTISFGPQNNTYWNCITHHVTQKSAEKFAVEQLNIGQTLGYVIIQTHQHLWSIIDEMNAEYATIIPKGSFFTVQPISHLQLI